MKAIAILIVASILGAGFMAARNPVSNGSNGNSNVGTKPGDIGKRMDILVAARERGHDLAMFAGGCFWGTESSFRAQKGVVATAVGYSGGTTKNPTYEEVCTHTTGHAEAVLVEFDPKQTSYEDLVKAFFGVHDATQVNRQGPDIGTNYRSAIFYFDENQEKIANKVKDELQQTKYRGRQIATQVAKAGQFWMAEDYHQQYYEKRGIAPACGIGG